MENYSQLKTDVKSWLARTDLTDPELDNFISIALSRLNRLLRIGGMETESDLTLDAREVDLPDDFRGLRAIRIAGDSTYELRHLSPEQINNRELTGTGLPCFFTIRNSKLVLDKTPDQSYTAKIHYFQKFLPLSDSNTTNWLTDNAPDLLLWGCLCAAGKYIQDPDVMGLYKTNFDEAIAELIESDAFDKIGPAPVMRIEGPTY